MELGHVTTTNYEEGVVYCNVQPLRTSTPYEGVPVLRPHSGFIAVPEQGDTVMIDSLNDGTRFVTSVLNREEERPDKLREGELTIQLDADTRIRFKRRSDGTCDLLFGASGDMKLSSSGELALESKGDMKLNSEGSILVNGTDFEKHTHDYSWTDSGGSGTTNPPN
jgi:hypothetical protein